MEHQRMQNLEQSLIEPNDEHKSTAEAPATPKHRLFSSNWLNRRGLLAIFGTLASSTAIAGAKSKPQPEPKRAAELDRAAIATAKQEIAELRCQYALATDLIGTAQPDAVAKGRAIYHRIFTPTATIGAAGRDDVSGPDAWVAVVLDALKVYEKTQHLIGTQLVDLHNLPSQPGQLGTATMSSYLQAWHAKADGELWLFIGTYADELVYSTDNGWQISRMMLEQVSGETRQLNS